MVLKLVGDHECRFCDVRGFKSFETGDADELTVGGGCYQSETVVVVDGAEMLGFAGRQVRVDGEEPAIDRLETEVFMEGEEAG